MHPLRSRGLKKNPEPKRGPAGGPGERGEAEKKSVKLKKF